MRALGPRAPLPAIDATSNEAASSTATPPVNPELVRAVEVPGAKKLGSNVVEILVFRGLSTPLALVLVVLQGRFLEPSGRGRFVLAVLTVSIFSRLLSQLGVAVANHMSQREWDTEPELRPLAQRALGIALALGILGSAAIVGIGALTPSVGARTAAIAATALAPNVIWQTASGILLGLARIRAWNYVQLASPLLTVIGTLVLVVALGGQVHAALAAWTIAHVLTAILALFLMRDLWLPLRMPSLVDGVSQTLVRLALAMGALQVIALIGYRAELFVLEAIDGVERGRHLLDREPGGGVDVADGRCDRDGDHGARRPRERGGRRRARQALAREEPALYGGGGRRRRRHGALRHPVRAGCCVQRRAHAAAPAAARCRGVRARADPCRVSLGATRAAAAGARRRPHRDGRDDRGLGAADRGVGAVGRGGRVRDRLRLRRARRVGALRAAGARPKRAAAGYAPGVSSRRCLGFVALAALAATGSVAAATGPAVSLSGGQIRYFLPGALHTGDTIRCVVHGKTIRAKIPAPSAAGTSGADFLWKRGGASVQITRRTNGATEIACGTTLASPIHRANMPYVIGQNGLGLIRGPNRLDRLEQLFGAASSLQSSAALCSAAWSSVGLRATFAGSGCTSGSILRSATVSGARWSSLNGIRIGETVAEMRWQSPGTKRISSAHGHTVWLLSTAIASSSQLFAVTGPAGTVTSLTSVIR